jgi:hypothetical protein
LRRCFLAVWPAASLLVTLSCSNRPTEEECGQLLDHYTELLVREENPGAVPELVFAKQSQARLVAAQDPRFEFSACSRRVTRKQHECAMQATAVDEVERCLIF